jgi:endonuclease III
MDKRETVTLVVEKLKSTAGKTMLASMSDLPPWQILISTILSARSKDETTLPIAHELFRKYPTVAKLASANQRDVEKIIRKTGFYRNKSKFVIETAKKILEEHHGEVPRSLEELMQLPGVGRKVANCVLVYAFQIPAIPVDTHVHRISNRLGVIKTRNPEHSEQELMKILPEKYWVLYNDLLVWHGKTVCKPIGPQCSNCVLNSLCKKVGVEKKYFMEK